MPQRPGPDRPFRPERHAAPAPARLRPGMTLIELMIVLLVSIIILGAAFSLYQVNARYYVAQDALLEQQQNLRAALYSIARDVRMAGNGLGLMSANRVNIYINDEDFGASMGMGTGWFRYRNAKASGVRAIFGEDGGRDGADTLTVFHADIESVEPLGSLNLDYTPGNNSTPLTLLEPLDDGMLNNGDMIAVANANAGLSDVVVLEAGSVAAGVSPSITIGYRFRPNGRLSDVSFPAGSNVYRLRDVTLVTYFLDDERRLMANFYGFTDGLEHNPFGDEGGPVVLANDIEDFQVRYILDDQPAGLPLNEIKDEAIDELNETRLDNEGRTVRAVRLAVVSRSRIANETTAAGRPVSVFNHEVDEPADGFQRRILTDTVYLRNY